jgi:hypothetical protein
MGHGADIMSVNGPSGIGNTNTNPNTNNVNGANNVAQPGLIIEPGPVEPPAPAETTAVNVGKIKVDGVADVDFSKFYGNLYPTGPGQGGGSHSTGREHNGYDRGWMEVTNVEATKTGARVTVRTGYRSLNEPINLLLQAELRDGAERKVITLSTIAKDLVLNPSTYEGQLTFDVSYKDINKYLKAINPKLSFTPGSTLAVSALWPPEEGSGEKGHEWGGFYRGGTFTSPAPVGGTAAAQSGQSSTGGEVPLDIGVKMESELTDKYPVLAYGKTFNSRVEFEPKWVIETEADFNRIVSQLDRMANNPGDVKAIFGEGWTLEPVERYWEKNPQTNGFKQIPMVDMYYDDKKFTLANNQVAVRFRNVEGESTNIFGVKPGPGITDEKGVTRRIEYGVPVADYAKNDPATLKPFLTSSEHLNPFRHLNIPGLDPAEVLQQSAESTAYRNKYKLVHQGGTEIEISVDDVNMKFLHLKDALGNLVKVRFFQFEADIGHLQVASTNVVNGQTQAKLGGISDPAEQKKFIAGVSEKATFGGAPRIHTIEDLNNPSLLKNQGYLLAQDANLALQKALFPEGIKIAIQKFSHAVKMATGK